MASSEQKNQVQQPEASSGDSSSLALSSYFTTQVEVTDDPFDSVFVNSAVDQSEPLSTRDPDPTPTDAKSPKQPSLLPVEQQPPTNPSLLHRLRQRDAWLPSESTRQTLLLSPGTTHHHRHGFVEIRPFLCESDVQAEEKGTNLSVDPYRHTLIHYLHDAATVDALRRIPIPSEQSSNATETLKDLISNGWYRIALKTTRRLLTNWGYLESHGGAVLTSFTAQIWLARLALLVRTRNYDLAERELASFQNLDAPNVYFEHAADVYPGRAGSIIPFSLRVVHAELPFYLNRTEEALDRLYYMLVVITRIRSNLQKGYTEDGTMALPTLDYRESSSSLWACREVRVLSSCLSIYMSEMDYHAAIETVHQLAITCANCPSVLRGLSSVLGRIYLQLGNLDMAKTYFSQAVATTDITNKQPHLIQQQLFQKALLCLGKNEYEEAHKLFAQVLSMDPTNVVAANNMVVSALYFGQLSGSIRILESLTSNGLALDQPPDVWTGIDKPPPPSSISITTSSSSISRSSLNRRFCLHDTLVFNLAVLYEVESDSATAKKVKLLQRMASLPGEPVHISAFKLSQAT